MSFTYPLNDTLEGFFSTMESWENPFLDRDNKIRIRRNGRSVTPD
jgi:hypothetical protein